MIHPGDISYIEVEVVETRETGVAVRPTDSDWRMDPRRQVILLQEENHHFGPKPTPQAPASTILARMHDETIKLLVRSAKEENPWLDVTTAEFFGDQDIRSWEIPLARVKV